MRLSWRPGFSLEHKPTKRRRARTSKQNAQKGIFESKQLEFILEPFPTSQPPSLTRNDGGEVQSILRNHRIRPLPFDHWAESSSSIIREPLPLGTLEADPSITSSPNLGDVGSSSDLWSESMNGSHPERADTANAQLSWGSDSFSSFYSDFSSPDQAWEDQSPTHTDIADVPDQQSALALAYASSISSIPHEVTFNSLLERFSAPFERYNSEFCKIPLTSESEYNPYKCRSSLSSEPMLLVHSVMALAGHHVNSPAAEDHHQKALQLLRQSLNSPRKDVREYEALLDAIIILSTHGSARSIFGNWAIHLMGAKSVIEASGGIKKWMITPRSQAQVAVLTWWDAGYSIFCRERCILPPSYFEAVNSKREDQQWDYFALCGCPVELARITRELAYLSSEKRKSSALRFPTFDEDAISQIEERLHSWRYESRVTALDDEESMQQDQDQMHISEAWRNALLLYIFRVFHWQPGAKSPVHVALRARIIVDHLFACRQEKLFPKQALLPLFLAGCELRDKPMRENITQLCSRLHQATRYRLFGDAIPLLRHVWQTQEVLGYDSVWWGAVVDQYHEEADPLQSRLCLV